MNRLTVSCWMSTIFACAAWVSSALAAPPLIDRPTPPPCAADGRCYPNVNEWGFYPGRWRRWPGHEEYPVPAQPSPAERLGPDVSPYEIPPPELEDAQAPPASTKDEATKPPATPAASGPATSESSAQPAAPTNTPAAPSLDQSIPSLDPSSPDFEMPPTFESSPFFDEPESPTSDLDPPPALPFASSSAKNGSSTGVNGPLPSSSPAAAQPRSANDPPPGLPWAYRSASL